MFLGNCWLPVAKPVCKNLSTFSFHLHCHSKSTRVLTHENRENKLKGSLLKDTQYLRKLVIADTINWVSRPSELICSQSENTRKAPNRISIDLTNQICARSLDILHSYRKLCLVIIYIYDNVLHYYIN